MYIYCILGIFLVIYGLACQEIVFNTQKILHVTDDRFLSVAIDSGVIRRHWEKFHPRSSKVKKLALALYPCYLRMGGTDADFLIFDPEDRLNNVKPNSPSYSLRNHSKPVLREKEFDVNVDLKLSDVTNAEHGKNDILPSPKQFKHPGVNDFNRLNLSGQTMKREKRDIGYYGDEKKDLTNYTMSATMYDEIHTFVSSVHWDLIFDLNVLLRRDGGWDPTNAIQLMNYTVAKGYKMAGWELGNEPDQFLNMFGNKTVPPETLTKDFKLLKALISLYPEFTGTQLLGPSVAQLAQLYMVEYFCSFLDSGGADVVTAASFHQYYINGRTATIDQFTDPDVLNFLSTEVALGMDLTKMSGSKARVWIGETSSAWGGGAPGLSDRYVAGFMWLDKLGIAAKFGIDVVIRQSFYGGHYALLDSETLDPNPDYWLSLLYKVLVGRRVLEVNMPESTGTLRVYAHCTATNRTDYTAGSVTVYVLNLAKTDINVTFQYNTTLHVYSMLPPDGDLKSQYVALNGQQLVIQDDKLPNLLIPVKTSGPVTISALSYAFIVMPDINLAICS